MPDNVRRPVALTKLIDTFDRLFPDEPLSRLVVGRSGMPDGTIAYSARSIENWTNIVNEAIRQDALDNLAAAAVELHPNVPEIPRYVQDYSKWAAQQNVSPEGIAKALTTQPAPGFLERARLVIVAWFGVAVGCFAFVGVLARESTHHLFDLPDSGFTDAFTSPGESAAAGLRFVGRSLVVAATYFAYNPVGSVLVVILAGTVLYFAVRRRPLIERAYIPAVVLPVVVVGAFVKTLYYDLPVLGFTGVLTKLGIDSRTFDPPAMFSSRAERIWSGVVCSRIANFPEARSLCGTETSVEHMQNLYGVYLLDVIFTIAVCALGIAALRKLTLPSHARAWNLPRAWNRASILVIAVALLGALLPVPWTYARTVASMEYPYICTAECEFHIRVDANKTFAFYPADSEIGAAQAVPTNAQVSMRDILDVAFTNQVKSPSFVPHERGSRLGGD
jgi:ABC-type sugar transport system permease subunit